LAVTKQLSRKGFNPRQPVGNFGDGTINAFNSTTGTGLPNWMIPTATPS